MTTVAEHMESTSISAQTPDGIAFATIRGDRDVTFSLVPGYYATADEARLADKVAKVAKLLWVARVKEFFRMQSELVGREIRTEPAPRSDVQREREAARNQIEATGRSSDGVINVASVGLLTWTVQITPGSLRGLSEQQFCADVKQAAEMLVSDHRQQLRTIWNTAGEWQGRPVAPARPGELEPPRRVW
ncbi:MAG: hypothetical protein V9G04_03190 [Nocardioides sp.]|jgi:hypothetical protein